MEHRVIVFVAALLSAFTASASPSRLHWPARDSSSPQSQEMSKKSGGQESQAADPSAEEGKKTKRVWTNDNLKEVNSSGVSQVGSDKNISSGKNAPVKPASPQAAAIRKQISTLQAQLANLDKQIAELQSFSKGEKSGDVGLQLHKGYTTEPIPDQIRKLEEKKKLVAAQIDSKIDEARKLGIQPGQLR
jgi:hypothetical protein